MLNKAYEIRSDPKLVRGIAGITPPLVASSAVCVAGSMMFILLPLLIDTLRTRSVEFSAQQVAFIGSMDATGMFIGAILALLVAPRADRRLLALASLAVLAASDLASLMAFHSGNLLAMSRLIAGVGGGLAMSVGYTSFSASNQPERAYAFFGTLQTLIGSAAYKLTSAMVSAHGLPAIFMASVAISIIGIAAGTMVERKPQGSSMGRSTTMGRDRGLVALGILAAVTYFLLGACALGVWSNVASIGRAYGISYEAAADAVSISLMGSVLGGLLIITLGKNHGRLIPTALLTGPYFLGLALLGLCQSALMFGIALLAFQFGTNWGSPAFGAISESDRSGRLSIIYLLALKAGFAFGPGIASRLLTRLPDRSVISIYFAASLFTALLLLLTLKAANRVAEPA